MKGSSLDFILGSFSRLLLLHMYRFDIPVYQVIVQVSYTTTLTISSVRSFRAFRHCLLLVMAWCALTFRTPWHFASSPSQAPERTYPIRSQSTRRTSCGRETYMVHIFDTSSPTLLRRLRHIVTQSNGTVVEERNQNGFVYAQ